MTATVRPASARRWTGGRAWWRLDDRSLAWGLFAAGVLAAFYVVVLTLASGFEHLRDQARADWWMLTLIIGGFGTQVAFIAELRRRSRHAHWAAARGAGTGTSAAGMVACCAHHLADLVPLAGVTGLAAFLVEWRTPLMLVGIAVNGTAAVLAASRLRAIPAGQGGSVRP